MGKAIGGFTLCCSKINGCTCLEPTCSGSKIFQVHPMGPENKKINVGGLLPGSTHGKASVSAAAHSDRSPYLPYVTHTLPGLTIMLGLSTARGQHHFPISSVLLSVAGEMSDPKLVLSQPVESGNRAESSSLRQDKQKHNSSRNSTGVKNI